MRIGFLAVVTTFGLWLLTGTASGAKHETCKRQWQKVGCFNDVKIPASARALRQILITDRDPTMKSSSGKTIDWYNWKPYVHGFACRCAEAAKSKGFKMFGLQYYGECWAGPEEETRYNMYGKSQQCIDKLRKIPVPCNDAIEDECMGMNYANYVYRLIIDGGYTEWSSWSECTVTCGTGVHSRKRTCTSPAPYNGGKNCVELGPATETKECNTQLCPSPCRTPKHFDVGVAIDVSKSIGANHFKLVKMFLEKFVAQFDIGPEQTHIGMLVYSTSAELLHSPTDPAYQTVAAQEEAARNAPYRRGGTRTDLALKKANEWFFSAKEDRKDVPNVLLVLTDGRTSMDSEPYSKVITPLQNKNVKIMAVGIGSEIDDLELKIIAMQNEKHKFHVSDFKKLIANMDELLDQACKNE